MEAWLRPWKCFKWKKNYFHGCLFPSMEAFYFHVNFHWSQLKSQIIWEMGIERAPYCVKVRGLLLHFLSETRISTVKKSSRVLRERKASARGGGETKTRPLCPSVLTGECVQASSAVSGYPTLPCNICFFTRQLSFSHTWYRVTPVYVLERPRSRSVSLSQPPKTKNKKKSSEGPPTEPPHSL